MVFTHKRITFSTFKRRWKITLLLALLKVFVIKGNVDFICALQVDEHVWFLEFETGAHLAQCYIELSAEKL